MAMIYLIFGRSVDGRAVRAGGRPVEIRTSLKVLDFSVSVGRRRVEAGTSSGVRPPVADGKELGHALTQELHHMSSDGCAAEYCRQTVVDNRGDAGRGPEPGAGHRRADHRQRDGAPDIDRRGDRARRKTNPPRARVSFAFSCRGASVTASGHQRRIVERTGGVAD